MTSLGQINLEIDPIILEHGPLEDGIGVGVMTMFQFARYMQVSMQEFAVLTRRQFMGLGIPRQFWERLSKENVIR